MLITLPLKWSLSSEVPHEEINHTPPGSASRFDRWVKSWLNYHPWVELITALLRDSNQCKKYWKLSPTLTTRSRCFTVYKYCSLTLMSYLRYPLALRQGATELRNEKCCFLMSSVFSVALQYSVILSCQNDKNLII